jgi:hypothetical protein
MRDDSVTGPARQDKTLERMQQERESPGATTEGRPDEAVSQPKSDTDPTLSVTGADLTTSNNSGSRRDDVARDDNKNPTRTE